MVKKSSNFRNLFLILDISAEIVEKFQFELVKSEQKPARKRYRVTDSQIENKTVSFGISGEDMQNISLM